MHFWSKTCCKQPRGQTIGAFFGGIILSDDIICIWHRIFIVGIACCLLCRVLKFMTRFRSKQNQQTASVVQELLSHEFKVFFPLPINFASDLRHVLNSTRVAPVLRICWTDRKHQEAKWADQASFQKLACKYWLPKTFLSTVISAVVSSGVYNFEQSFTRFATCLWGILVWGTKLMSSKAYSIVFSRTHTHTHTHTQHTCTSLYPYTPRIWSQLWAWLSKFNFVWKLFEANLIL